MNEVYQTTAAILTAVEVETKAVRSLYKEWDKMKFPGDSQVYYQKLRSKKAILKSEPVGREKAKRIMPGFL